MAALWKSYPTSHFNHLRCSSTPPTRNSKPPRQPQTQTLPLLKIAVSATTELLRLFSFSEIKKTLPDHVPISVSSINDVVSIIKSDYDKQYFVTGEFTSAIYAPDCTFEDPTIKFQGTELYARNLSLLVPFFDDASILLKEIGCESELLRVVAVWRLRTYLKVPWRPLICIDGRTMYELDEDLRIVRHVERWNVSAIEAVVQIFTPSFGKSESD